MPCIQNYRGVAVAYEHTNSNSQPASSEIAAGQVQILFHVSWKKTGDSNWTRTFLLEITDRALRSPPSLNHHRASQTCLKLWPHTEPFSFSTLPFEGFPHQRRHSLCPHTQSFRQALESTLSPFLGQPPYLWKGLSYLADQRTTVWLIFLLS